MIDFIFFTIWIILNIYFIFFKPINIEYKKNIEYSYINNLFNYIKTISPYIFISILVGVIVLNNDYTILINNYLYFISLIILFVWYLWIHNIFINNKIKDIERYKYIKTNKKEKQKIIKFLIISFIILFLLILYNIYKWNNDIIRILLLTWPYIILINLSDINYELITDRIILPFIFNLWYYLIFVLDYSYNFVPFSYFIMSISLIILLFFEKIYSFLKKEDINIFWFADPYIITILLLFFWIWFIPFLFLMFFLLKIKYIKNKKNKKEYPLFTYLFFVYLLYIIWISNNFI